MEYEGMECSGRNVELLISRYGKEWEEIGGSRMTGREWTGVARSGVYL